MTETTETTNFTDVILDVDDGIATVTMNRPDHRNAMRLNMMRELDDALRRAEADSAVRAVIVTGAGESFCVGADLFHHNALIDGMVEDHDGHTPTGYREPAGRIAELIHSMHVPVIAAVNGHAVGGGATIIAAMDVRIASSDAKFGFVFTQRGVVPEGASTWFLPRLVGIGRATDWLLSGRVFTAAEALEAGFVSQLVPAQQVLPVARAYARQFTTVTSAQSVALTRHLLHAAWRYDHPRSAAEAESQVYARVVASADAQEGVTSFLEGRPPSFRDDRPAWSAWDPKPRT